MSAFVAPLVLASALVHHDATATATVAAPERVPATIAAPERVRASPERIEPERYKV